MTDTVIEIMARAWPDLLSLEIYAAYDQVDDCDGPIITLRKLECFAVHCPKLEKLALAVDTEKGVSDYRTKAPNVLSSLNYLGLFLSRGEGSESEIAFMIETLWPNLRKLETGWPMEDPDWDAQLKETIAWELIWERIRGRQLEAGRSSGIRSSGGQSGINLIRRRSILSGLTGVHLLRR